MFEYADPSILCSKGEFTDVDLLENITNKMMPMVQILPFLSPTMSFLYFDLASVLVDEDGNREMQLTIKHIPSAVKTLMTNDCCGFTWYEQKMGIKRAKVDATATAGTSTLIVDLASNLEGIVAPTQISVTVKATGTIFVATVTNVVFNAGDKATLTLDRNTPATIAAGDIVFRGAKDRKSCDSVDNTYGSHKTSIQTGQFQSFSGHVEFKICELNQERRLATMQGISSGIYLMNHRIKNLFEGLILELSWALLLGTNSVETASFGSKMQGLLTKIQKSQIECGLSLIQKIDCCGKNVGNTFQDQKDTVANIVAFLQERIKSGLYKGDVTLLLNQDGYEAIEALRPAIESYFNAPGVLMTHSNDTYEGIRDYKVIKAMSFTFSSGHSVDFVQFPVFDAITEGTAIAIALPKEMISLVQKEVRGIGSDMKTLLLNNGQIPTFKFRKDELLQSGAHYQEECRKYVTGIDLGQMIVGAEHGAYGALLGFSACTTNACDVDAGDLVNFIDDECTISPIV